MNERIKLLRKALELNQTDFGARIGVKQGTVAAYESGARVPLDSVIVSICREFGVSESWLRSGEGEMFLQLSREEEITKFCMSIIRDPDSEFQRQFVSVLARLEPPSGSSSPTWPTSSSPSAMRKKKTRNNPAPPKQSTLSHTPDRVLCPFFKYFLTSVLQSSMLRI